MMYFIFLAGICLITCYPYAWDYKKKSIFFKGLQRSSLTSLLLLNGCAVGPNYTRPTAPLPKTYTSKSLGSATVATQTKLGKAQKFVANEDIPAQWWTLFHSKPLNDLIAASLKHNPEVSAAQAALRAALENVYAQRGAFYPFLGASFSPTKQQVATILTSALASNQNNYALYTGQLYISYTPDVFGGIRRQLESLVAQAKFQGLQLEATYLTLSTNVVNAAIQEAAAREQIIATKQIIASQAKILNMLKQRLNLGDSSLADIAAQEAALAASEATLPPLEKQFALQSNLLNALTGRFPDDKLTPEFNLNTLQLPTELPLSLPSTLIEHRPDIRAVEEQMHAANAMIGIAIANRLPNFTIGLTNGGTAATRISSLFASNTPFWTLAGIITQPIFDAGTLKHKQRSAQANYEQSAAQYRSTVINAYQNVADTLKAIKFDANALHAASKAERAALRSLSISKQQLVLGDSSTLFVLINEQLYLQAKLNLILAQANRLSDTVALFQALGGGWWNKPCTPNRVRTYAKLIKTDGRISS